MKLMSLLMLIVFCVSSEAAASEAAADEAAEAALDKIFAGQAATFIMYDVEKDEHTVYNPTRALKRFLPASTFKIPNSLIGLSVGAIESVDEVLPYLGDAAQPKRWQKDMSLREAIVVSNVPIYRELARRIGLEKMKAEVARLGYGNADIDDKVDLFWLEGPLKISAAEQCAFLSDLARSRLPLAPEIQAAIRDILLDDQGQDWKLYAKTGATMRDKEQVGWWVGWLEKEGRLYCFALNIDLEDYERDLPKRVESGRAALASLGLL